MNRLSLLIGASTLTLGIGLTQAASTHVAVELQASSPRSILAVDTSLESLPVGQYYYVPSEAAETTTNRRDYVLLRKAGSTVIGLDGRSQACFRGFLEADRIVDATRVFPPYQPDSRWDTQDELVDLSQYRAIEQTPTDAQAETLRTCMQFFWR